jgi:hypothetical protein
LVQDNDDPCLLQFIVDNSSVHLSPERFGNEISAEWRPIMADAEMRKVPLNVSALFGGNEFRLDVSLAEPCTKLVEQDASFLLKAVEALERVSDRWGANAIQTLGPSVELLQKRN